MQDDRFAHRRGCRLLALAVFIVPQALRESVITPAMCHFSGRLAILRGNQGVGRCFNHENAHVLIAAPSRSVVKRLPSNVVTGVNVGSLVKQHLHNLGLMVQIAREPPCASARAPYHQWRDLLSAASVYVRSILQQQLHTLHAPLRSSFDEWTDSNIGRERNESLRLYIGTVVQESLDNVSEFAVIHSDQQRSESAAVPSIDVRQPRIAPHLPGRIEERSHHIVVAPGCPVVQSRPPSFISDIQVGHVGQQHLDHLPRQSAINRPHE
mmetsp:Transcript_44581/g.125986  ORF Transcript_44581/g.125986 Transcript_44581/m.125986 type:complete len:267 (+) Transcript_44581:1285-2085(+)